MITNFQEKKLTKLFKFWDANGNGVLDEPDYMQVAQRLSAERGWAPGTPEHDFLHQKLHEDWLEAKKFADTNDDNKISLEEWIIFCETFMGDPEMYDITVTNVASAIVDAVDVDNNGYLDKKEWQLLFRIYGKPNDEAIYAHDIMSENGKVKIDKAKVLQLLNDFFYSNDTSLAGNYMFGKLD
jgi:juvenile hormone diol kinase